MTEYTDFKILLDEPADNPQLGFNDYSQALAEIIEYSPPSSPLASLAIGVREKPR